MKLSHWRRSRRISICGMPGIGKSDVVLKACKKLGVKVRKTKATGVKPNDYRGLPYKVSMVDDFCTELGPAPYSVQTAMMQLLLNRKADKCGASSLPMALRRRLKCALGPSTFEEWIEYIDLFRPWERYPDHCW